MALNEGLDFENVDVQVKRAFLRRPERVLLKPPVRLYKWTNRQLISEHGISAWWSFVEPRHLPSGTLIEGFRTAEERSRRLGKSHREFARSRAAISDEFGNTLERLLLIQLLDDAWGFVGQASGQPEFSRQRSDLQHVFLIGGAPQVWLPNLTPRHVREVPAVA
jgi:hypothetical protein